MTRWLIAIAVFVITTLSAFAQEVRTVQWLHSKLVPANSSVTLEGANPFTWASATFPYTVPQGYWLGIVDMQFSSKLTDGSPGAGGSSPRASYLVLFNLVSVPDNIGSHHFRVPIVVPPGTTITAAIINNDNESQWMGSVITAVLVPQVPGQTWQDAFAYLYSMPPAQ